VLIGYRRVTRCSIFVLYTVVYAVDVDLAIHNRIELIFVLLLYGFSFPLLMLNMNNVVLKDRNTIYSDEIHIAVPRLLF
jgi:hypothetical protein